MTDWAKKRARWFRWIGGVAVLALVVMQFFNPARTNPAVLPGHDMMATNTPPDDVAKLLKDACYNCHSSETVWPWYSRVMPVSWFVVGDVDEARGSMNFSEWPHDAPARVRKRWRHIADDVESREMPLRGYTWMHPESRLTDQQRARLVQWCKQAGQEDSE
jgi:hypothetical protein